MRQILSVLIVMGALYVLQGCKRSADEKTPEKPVAPTQPKDSSSNGGGSTQAGGDDHAHDEAPLGKIKIGDLEVKLAQGHGSVEAGKEGHLVVKLPYNDKGQTIVRAWIGTENRLQSVVGKGEYAPSHDDYDVHAVAPSPLPESVMWWIEVEKPDGIRLLGSIRPRLE